MNDVLTVSELTQAIKKQLEPRFAFVSVQGEISNFKEQASGHLYFTLKDAQSQVSAVLFKGNAKHLSRRPKEGDQVVVKGELSIYVPRGSYQIVVRELQFSGVGALLLKLHELKIKLEQKGWFDPKHKKPLPKFPKVIGVVTSPTGAVIQDIINILSRRFSGFHLILNPVKVQGEGAAQEIAQAIDQFNRYKLADVLIVGRGGGSLEDLWSFNEEIVAEAIFRSEIPILSAVGHETDFSIADYVADLRAPTPSAAAEMVIAEKQQQLTFLQQTEKRLNHALRSSIEHNRLRLAAFTGHPLFSDSQTFLGKYHQMLDDTQAELNHAIDGHLLKARLQLDALRKQAFSLNPLQQVKVLSQKLTQWDKALQFSIRNQIQIASKKFSPLQLRQQLGGRIKSHILQKRQNLDKLAAHLHSIDPRNLLTKGYGILFHEKKDSVILSTQELSPGQALRILMHDGKIHATINDVTS